MAICIRVGLVNKMLGTLWRAIPLAPVSELYDDIIISIYLELSLLYGYIFNNPVG